MLSMTGHGSAVHRDQGLDIEVEIRSLNHRFFNLKLGLPTALGRHEHEVEKMVRGLIARGSINVMVSIKQTSQNGPPLPDRKAVETVYKKLRQIQKDLKIPGQVSMESLLQLPHIWSGEDRHAQQAKLWPQVKKLIEGALEDHGRMRVREGKGIRKDFQARLSRIEELVDEIREFAPQVLKVYQKKLLERVKGMTAQHGIDIGKNDVAREVAIFADRCDINEELQRLKSHCKQFRKVIGRTGQIGRKLDFLTQEMAREANTLAAKGNHSNISALAVEIKSEIEKIKEQAENTE